MNAPGSSTIGMTLLSVLTLVLCTACGKDDAGPEAKDDAATPVAEATSTAAPAPASAAPAAPAVKTTRFEDWELVCREPEGAPRQCEIVQTLAAKEQPIARIAVGRSPDNGAMAIAVNLPSAVAFAIPVTLAGDGGADPQVALSWRRCGPAGCFADMTPPAELFNDWAAHPGAGRMAFLDFADNPVSLPYSFRGLAAAIKALENDSDTKAE